MSLMMNFDDRPSRRDFALGATAIGAIAGVAALLLAFGKLQPLLERRFPVIVETNGAQGVRPGSLVTLNGVTVVPQTKTKTGDKTTIRFSPDAGRTDVNNQVKLIYADSNGVSNTNQWAFTIITAGGSSTRVTGQWDFDFGDFRATVGQPLAYFDPTYDGPTGSAPTKTQFGT